ncbi:hypothetical protein HID58_021637, partial [Brassica napus]
REKRRDITEAMASGGSTSFSNSNSNKILVSEKKSWKNFFSYLIGPGFLVSIAYIDPGNFETDLQSGAQYKYELLWIILVASCAALVIQSLAANLGVVTGKHLAEHCRAEYSKVPNFMLWVVAEIAVVALIGTAFALNMLFNIPVWIGVLLTGFSTLILLALQKYGIRKLEFLIAFLVLTIAVCFLIELHYSKPDPKEVLYGLFVPQLKGNGATGLAISLLGAMVMPDVTVNRDEVTRTRIGTTTFATTNHHGHRSTPPPAANHWATHLMSPDVTVNRDEVTRTRIGTTTFATTNHHGHRSTPPPAANHWATHLMSPKIPRSVTGIKEACRYYMIESGLALTVAFLINVSVISVSGAVCNASDLSPEDQASCEDLDLNKASFLLRNVVGKWSSKLFAIALLASGQSSTITGTYAGQYVMQGFLNLTIRPWLRNFLTRCLAIIPSLIVALIGGSAGAGKLIIIASMVLSFELPFALVPLLKFTCSKTKMGSHANSLLISSVTWIIGGLIMGINIYYLVSSFIKLILHGHMKLVAVVFLGILGFSGIAIYLAAIGYLVFRKNRESSTLASNSQTADTLPREDIVNMHT